MIGREIETDKKIERADRKSDRIWEDQVGGTKDKKKEKERRN